MSIPSGTGVRPSPQLSQTNLSQTSLRNIEILPNLVLIHITTGDKHTVTVRCALSVPRGKGQKVRPILVVVWGNLAGEFAFDVERNALFSFGPSNGIRRMPMAWKAEDIQEAGRIWHEKTEKRNNMR